MKRSLLAVVAIVGLLAFGIRTADAQQKISVDINKANFSWAWTQGTGGTVTFFTIKCGAATGNYTIATQVSDPTARTFPVKSVVSANGDYFCAISASNEFGESANSGEVFFGAGVAPLPASSFGISVK